MKFVVTDIESIMKRTFLLLMAVFMLLPVGVTAKKKTADVKVISYNIRLGVAKDGTNSWEFRYPASALMILDQKPDIFGVQEAYDFQVNYLEEACEDYKSVGGGREDGKHEGEHMLAVRDSRGAFDGLGCRLLPHCHMGAAQGQG